MKKTCGRILKGIGGFYYVSTQQGTVECRARGSFRNKELSPFVGDFVEIEFDSDKMCGVVEKIKQRKNFIIRPAVSNIDRIYIVCSTTLPQPSLLNIDKLTAIAINSNIEPIIVISKTDLQDADYLFQIYKKAGFKVFETSEKYPQDTQEIKNSLSGFTSVFIGNSGVGKSSLINRMYPKLSLKTGEVSLKLSRGKHTTRHIELFPIENGGYIVDTPGFSTIDFEGYGFVKKENVADCFPDFSNFVNDCRFPDCRHIGERDCGVKNAVQNGQIASSRYESYCALYSEAEKIPEWELKQKR